MAAPSCSFPFYYGGHIAALIQCGCTFPLLHALCIIFVVVLNSCKCSTLTAVCWSAVSHWRKKVKRACFTSCAAEILLPFAQNMGKWKGMFLQFFFFFFFLSNGHSAQYSSTLFWLGASVALASLICHYFCSDSHFWAYCLANVQSDNWCSAQCLLVNGHVHNTQIGTVNVNYSIFQMNSSQINILLLAYFLLSVS